MTSFHLVVDSTPSILDSQQVVAALAEFNRQRLGPENLQHLSAFIRDDRSAILAGILGYTHYNWLYITHLWVAEPYRHRGWGSTLVAAAEREALRRGCRNAAVDTFDFQALPFYRRLGYEVFGRLEEYPEGHTRYFLRKRDLEAVSDRGVEGAVTQPPEVAG